VNSDPRRVTRRRRIYASLLLDMDFIDELPASPFPPTSQGPTDIQMTVKHRRYRSFTTRVDETI
jgi:hypothetical protein